MYVLDCYEIYLFLSRLCASADNKWNFHRFFSMVIFSYFFSFFRHFYRTILIISTDIIVRFEFICCFKWIKIVNTTLITINRVVGRMSDTVEKRRKIYKKHYFGYIKKFIPWRYVVVFAWKLDIFSFHLLYRSFYKSKKIKRYYQVKLTRSRYFHAFKNGTNFSQDPASHFVP